MTIIFRNEMICILFAIIRYILYDYSCNIVYNEIDRDYYIFDDTNYNYNSD